MKVKRLNEMMSFEDQTNQYARECAQIISEIKYKIVKYGGCVSMQELQADSSPVFEEGHNTIDLIEVLWNDVVSVTSYGGYKYQDELDEYDVKYERLGMDTLEEILNSIDFAIENELLELSDNYEKDPEVII